MNDKKYKKIKSRTISIAFYTLFAIYYLIGLMRIINGSVIMQISKQLFTVMYVIIPLIIINLPFMLKACGEKSKEKCVKKAFVAAMFFAVIAVITELGLMTYLARFTVDKWESFPHCRYLMTYDLDSNYKIVGMSKNEIINLLGTPNQYNSSFTYGGEAWTYGTKKGFLFDKYYVVEFDKNGIAADTNTGRTSSSL